MLPNGANGIRFNILIVSILRIIHAYCTKAENFFSTCIAWFCKGLLQWKSFAQNSMQVTETSDLNQNIVDFITVSILFYSPYPSNESTLWGLKH